MLIEFDSPIAEFRSFFEQTKKSGGRALFVGGCVRDALLGIHPKDFDIEVSGLSAESVENMLRAAGVRFDIAGRAFGVFKVHGAPVDVALPRRESKCGTGHTGFVVKGDPNMSLEDAAARRDFTVNSIYFDPLSGEILDPFGGREDLKNGVLRHTSSAFGEDPLRVLRAMQFIARFQFQISPDTLEICRNTVPEELSAERIFEEWVKLMTKGEKPSMGLTFLRDCGWVKYFPELSALIGVKQDPYWHPEGDVWNHTLCAMDAFARDRLRGGDEASDAEENTIVGFAVLCHDFGKPASTSVSEKDGRIHSYGHEAAGAAPTEAFLRRMTRCKSLIDNVVALVRMHMRPRALFLAESGDSAVRRLANSIRIDRLLRVCSADANGSFFHTSEDFKETEKWLTSRAEALKVKDSAPKPIILGRHLLALGVPAGPQMKPIIDKCFEAQLDGEFSDEQSGVSFLKTLIQKS